MNRAYRKKACKNGCKERQSPGVPKVTILDNTKAAVTKPDLVDPILNKSCNEMAKHYGTTLVPARSCKFGFHSENLLDATTVLRAPNTIPVSLSRKLFKKFWPRLIQKIYNVNPLISPNTVPISSKKCLPQTKFFCSENTTFQYS